MKPPSAGAAGGKVYAILKKASEEYIVFFFTIRHFHGVVKG